MTRKNKAMQLFIAVSVTLIFLVLFEIGIFLASELYYAKLDHQTIPYDVDRAYLNNVRQVRLGYKQQYCSYLDHCASLFSNDGFSVRAIGERTTVNPCATANATPIYVFGGSTTFCAEVLDEDTWPSQLSKKLCDMGLDVSVRNFGDTGYTNSQETIKLLLKLRDGERPGIVVFFDGYNEYYSTYQNGKAGESQNTINRNTAFTLFTERNLFGPFRVTAAAKAIWFIAGGKKKSYDVLLANVLGEKTKAVYKKNTEIVDNLEAMYGYDAFYFWQPTVYTKRPLTTYEKAHSLPYLASFAELAGYSDTASLQKQGFYDLTHIFDDANASIFLDDVHVGREGNRLIAGAVAERIALSLQRQ